jgi:hypothetical protein
MSRRRKTDDAELEQATEQDSLPPRLRVRLGPSAKVGALVVDGVTITRQQPGTISRARYDELRARYDLVEA